MTEPPQKLLVVKPSSFGDIVHGLLVLEQAKAALPGLHVTWVVRERFAPLVEACPAVDTRLIYERKKGLGTFRGLLREIAARDFDLVWDMQGLLRSALMARAAGVPRRQRWGRRDGREGATLFYRRVDAPPGGFPAHAVEVLLPFLATLGLPPRLDVPLRLGFSDYPWQSFFATAEPRFTLFLDSRGARKVWKGFEALTQLIFEEVPSARVAWCAGEPTEPSFSVPADRFLNLSGCPFPEMLALCSQPSVVIANDSGPMHLAAALGQPVVAIFGPTSPERFAPYPPDAPHHRALEAPEGDLARLQPETVLAAARELSERESG